MTLYLKYRPQKIADLDLPSVRESLSRILSQKDIPHAYLFSGPKGTGKTSAARIFAKALNCENQQKGDFEPCNECDICLSITKGENLDIIEIDAASHRGIDDIRSLREAVKLSAISAKKKVYIIDEAHMLTTEASNALLKILEEPPSHVVFILATTNPEKLLDTVRSRTTLVPFVKAKEEDIIARLHKIAKGEELKIEKDTDDAFRLIAKSADGAFRDAVKQLEYVISSQQPLTVSTVSELLHGKKSFDPDEFLKTVRDGNHQSAIEQIEKGSLHGVTAKSMTQGVIDILRGELRSALFSNSKIDPSTLTLLELFMKAYKEIPGSYIEVLPLELLVSSLSKKNTDEEPKNESKKTVEQKSDTQPDIKKADSAPSEETRTTQKSISTEGPSVQPPQKEEPPIEEKKEPLKRKADTVVSDVSVFSEELWTKVLTTVRSMNASTEALLRASKPLTYDGSVLTVAVFYKFHKERLESHPHRDVFEEILQGLLGVKPRVECVLTEPPTKKVEEIAEDSVVLSETKVDDKIVDMAKEVFGS